MFPYSCRQGIVLRRNWLKFFRMPNHHLLPPFAEKLSKMRENNASMRGLVTRMNGQFKSPSNLSASSTWNTRMGSTVKQLPIAELTAVRFCCGDTSCVFSKITQNIMLYNTPTRLRHKTIHSGTNTTSQLKIIFFLSFHSLNQRKDKNSPPWNKFIEFQWQKYEL